VLPLLQRHLTEAKKKDDEKQVIRSYVAVSIAKVIRKLPVNSFKIQL